MFMMCRFRVHDFARFQESFYESEELRLQYGLREGWVLRNANDPNELVVVLRCEGREQAEDFLKTHSLKEYTQRATVVGEMTVEFLEQAAEVPAPVSHHRREGSQEFI